jgi:hypothetical protein
MTPEENARMAFEKNRKAQIEQKKVISDLKSRIERLEEMVSALLENAGLKPETAEEKKPVKAAKTKAVKTSTTEGAGNEIK